MPCAFARPIESLLCEEDDADGDGDGDGDDVDGRLSCLEEDKAAAEGEEVKRRGDTDADLNRDSDDDDVDDDKEGDEDGREHTRAGHDGATVVGGG